MSADAVELDHGKARDLVAAALGKREIEQRRVILRWLGNPVSLSSLGGAARGLFAGAEFVAAPGATARARAGEADQAQRDQRRAPASADAWPASSDGPASPGEQADDAAVHVEHRLHFAAAGAGSVSNLSPLSPMLCSTMRTKRGSTSPPGSNKARNSEIAPRRAARARLRRRRRHCAGRIRSLAAKQASHHGDQPPARQSTMQAIAAALARAQQPGGSTATRAHHATPHVESRLLPPPNYAPSTKLPARQRYPPNKLGS